MRISNRLYRANVKGFTLIEVMVSISIFMIPVLGIAASTQWIIRANQQSYFLSIATALAQDKLEDLKSNPASISSGGPITDVKLRQVARCDGNLSNFGIKR